MAFKIEATDPEDDPLIYQIQGPGSELFQMNSSSGEATLRAELDREVRFKCQRIYYICSAECVCLCTIVLSTFIGLIFFTDDNRCTGIYSHSLRWNPYCK